MGNYWILLVIFHAIVLVHTGNSCTIQITSDKDFVLIGDSAQVNCTSTDCKELYWETRLSKSVKINSDYFTTAEVKVTEWDDSPVKCLAEAEGKEFQKEFRVIPYALPSKVEIQMKKVLEEDKEHEVTCEMYDVAPLSHVTLSLTKSGNILYNKTFESDTSKGPQNRSHTFKFTASRSDDEQDFSCQVTLNLTRVTNKTVQSSPITAFTYTMPERPHIIAGKWIAYGTMDDISCAVYNTFPSERVTTELSVDGSPNLKALGDTMVVLGLNTTDLTLGEHQLTCVSQVYGFSKQSSMDIIIYELPVTNLTLSSEVVTVGDTLTVNCIIIQGNVEYFGLSVRVDDKEEKRVNAPNLEMNITIVNRKPNIPVICQTFIRETKVIQESSKNLTVHYQPDFNNVSCPRSLVWLEKSETRFQCSSEGNPKPEEQCSLNALSLEPSTSFTAERNMSGEYTCHASNILGNANISVAVAVQYAPGPTKVEISSSSIRAGGSVNLTCHSDALPPPVYSWSMPPSAQVVFSTDNSSITITDASSYHNGTYTCHARNQHGKSSEKLSLEVQSDNSVLYGVLIGVALCMCLGAALGIAYYCLRQNGKKGFYDLVRRKAGNHKDANIPLQESSDNGP